MRHIQGLAIFVALAAGCSPDAAPPSTQTGDPSPSSSGGVAIDGSWSRIGRYNDPWLSLHGLGNQALGVPAHRPPPTQPPPPDTALDWQFILQAPTSVTPALWVSGTAENDATDRMYAYGVFNGNTYFGAADNLYCTDSTLSCPNVAWYVQISAPIDGSSIALAPDGSRVYAVADNGRVYAADTATGTVPSGWPISLGATVSWASPWLDFTSQPYQLYIGDESGRVTRVDTATAKAVWTSPSLCKAIHSSPIVWNSVVYVGCDDGYLHRVNPATGAEYAPATKLCAATKCGANDVIYSAPFVDVADNRLLLGQNAQIINVDISPTTGCTTGAVSCPFQHVAIGASAIYYSSPFVDVANGFVYASYNNKLWRAAYNGTSITSMFVPAAQALKGSNRNLGYPKSTPMVFNGHIWVGDGGGYVNRYSSSTFGFENVTPQYGTTIDTTPVIDVAGGNIYYGTNGAGNATMPVNANEGSWVQLAQTW